MKNVGKWIAVILILVLVYLGWRWWTGSDQSEVAREKADPALLLDRVWIDRLPEAYTDYMHVFVALSDHPVGIFQKASSYRAEVELFQFKRKDTRVHLLFPQTNTKKQFTYKITRCDDLPPFDLCLDLNKNPWGGPKRYYGDSEQDGAAAVERYLQSIPDSAPEPFAIR